MIFAVRATNFDTIEHNFDSLVHYCGVGIDITIHNLYILVACSAYYVPGL